MNILAFLEPHTKDRERSSNFMEEREETETDLLLLQSMSPSMNMTEVIRAGS